MVSQSSKTFLAWGTSKLFDLPLKLLSSFSNGAEFEVVSLIDSCRFRGQIWTRLPKCLIISWIEWWWWLDLDILSREELPLLVLPLLLLLDTLALNSLAKLELSNWVNRVRYRSASKLLLRGDEAYSSNECMPWLRKMAFRCASEVIAFLRCEVGPCVAPLYVKYWWSVLYS